MEIADLRKTMAFPLQAAVLCSDCNAVSDGVHACPACGSSSLLSLASVLGRTTGDEGAEAKERPVNA
jgi:hypothetical protein